MLGNTAKSRLRHLFIEISKYEKQVEVLRQVLGEQPDFEPYAAFRRLDRKRKGYITEHDIASFLQDHEYKYDDDDCFKFVNRYDADRDARLSYNEFLRTVLPLDQHDLRAIVTQRKVYDVQYNENLPYEVEYALARLLATELGFWTDLEDLKIELVEDGAFSFPEAFAAIDLYSSGYLEIETLKKFLTRDNMVPTDETLVCLIRRLDQDGDNKISYEEFVDALKPATQAVEKLFTAKLRPSVLTREKFESLKAEEYSARTLLPKSSLVFTSPLKFTSPGATKVRAENFSSPKAYTASTGNLIKNSESKVKGYTSPKKLGASLRSNSKRDILDQAQSEELSQTVREKDWIKDFLRIVREIINVERELELVKQDLTLQKDFNLFDFFRVFDKTGSGSITVGEVEEGLSTLDIYPSREDLYLFIRRFDRDADGRLRFSDFSEAFSPYQPEFFKMLKSRTPVNSDLYFEHTQIFSNASLKLIKQVFMTHFENETIVEALRQKNERSPHYNLRKVFEYIDKDDDGYISVYDLKEAMNKNKNFITEKDISFLFNRFDKDKDELLSFVEFAQELTPKSHKKY